MLRCANLSGIDKRPLLITRKSQKPRCFKGVDVGDLPVFIGQMPTRGLVGFCSKNGCASGTKEKKNCFFSDNCTVHPRLINLNNIHLEFLPKNTKSFIQPINRRVIMDFKHFYRKTLIRMILKEIEEKLLKEASSAVTAAKSQVLDEWYPNSSRELAIS